MTVRAGRQTASVLRDHWQWRPDWAVDRPYLLWYLAFEDDALRAHVETVQGCLSGFPVLDLVPPQWLHVTLDDVGFVDELVPQQVDDVVIAAREALTGWSMPPLTLGPLTTTASAVVLRAQPQHQLGRLRELLRAASIDVLGAQALSELQHFRPHVSVAYTNAACDRDTLTDAIASASAEPIVVPVAEVTLAAVTRMDHHYQWAMRAEIALG